MSTPGSAVRSLGRSTVWEPTGALDVRGDVGHPQGLCRWGDGWLVTTVHPTRATGEILLIAADGDVLRRMDVTDGDRFHPGGVAVASGDAAEASMASECWVAVAEYRPRSTTTVMRLDADLAPLGSFRFDDHLGAICPIDDGTVFAVSWASRHWYRLDADGRILEERTTPTRWVDLQDVVAVEGLLVVASGVGALATPDGPVQLGGLVAIDVDHMTVVHDAPVAAWMPSGRVATYNGAHLDVGDDDSVTLHCLVDDTAASIGTWQPV